MNKINKLFILTAIVGMSLQAHADYSFANLGAQRMRSLAGTQATQAKPEQTKRRWWQFSKPKVSTEGETNPITQRNIVYNQIFDTATPENGTIAGKALDRDLEMLCGVGSPEATLLSKLDSTTTVFGEAMLAHTLLNPTNDISIIKQRQAAIQELANNPKLRKQLEKELESIKAQQAQMLSYWKFGNDQERKTIQTVYFDTIFTRGLNTNAFALEVGQRISTLGALTGVASTIWCGGTIAQAINGTSMVRSCWTATKWLAQSLDPRLAWQRVKEFRSAGSTDFFSKLSVEKQAEWTDQLGHSAQEYNDAQRVITKTNSTVGYGLRVATGAFFAWQSYRAYSDINNQYFLTRTIQQRGMSMAQLIRSSDALKKAIAPTAVGTALKTRMDEAYRTNDRHYTRLCKRLRTKTFSGFASGFSITGRALAAHKQIEAQKQAFAEMMMFVGELDAYLSMARLLQSEATNGYCTVSLIADQTSPVVEINNFWNPFIDSDKAVANSVAFGTTKNNRNMILTGANAGGKSTVLKSITVSILMAQSYGIAPAKSMKLSPFAKICSYLNITDDLAQGNSLFKSEVLRAKRLKETINNCTPNELVFSVIDELFTGTAADKGESAAYKFMQELTMIPNSMCIFATHYPSITGLSNVHPCINMRVGTPSKVNGKLVYPFTLEHGIANKNVAEDILREAGVLA